MHFGDGDPAFSRYGIQQVDAFAVAIFEDRRVAELVHMSVGGATDGWFEPGVGPLPVVLRTQNLHTRSLRPGRPIARDVDRAQQDALRDLTDLRPEDEERLSACQQRRVSHVAVEQQRSRLAPSSP